jgi:hypothetical protein
MHVISCIEEPQLIAKIPGHVRKRESLAGSEARAPLDAEAALSGLI